MAAQNQSLSYTSTSSLPGRNQIKASLDFVVTTIEHTLKNSQGGDKVLKFLQTDSVVQDQLKTLAANVKNKMIEIQDAVVDKAGHDLKRRQH